MDTEGNQITFKDAYFTVEEIKLDEHNFAERNMKKVCVVL